MIDLDHLDSWVKDNLDKVVSVTKVKSKVNVQTQIPTGYKCTGQLTLRRENQHGKEGFVLQVNGGWKLSTSLIKSATRMTRTKWIVVTENSIYQVEA